MSNAEWDGKGLPPVGCECEFAFHDGYEKVTIVAHVSDFRCSKKAVFQGEKQWGYASDLSLFRKIKSERDKAIEEMESHMIKIGYMLSRHCYADLYDAGYRKVEQ